MAASIYHTGEHSTTDGLWSIGGIERSGIWDSNLEEVWHLVSVGFYNLYPNDFGDDDSALTAAMDAARGGYFPEEPANYPDGAWYTYTDVPYPVHVHEYFYWAVVTNFGALSPEILPDRCAVLLGAATCSAASTPLVLLLLAAPIDHKATRTLSCT